MFLPVCHGAHFYLLVAICDVQHPKLYCLESIGGSYAVFPPLTEKFIEVLEHLQEGRCEKQPFSKSIPVVPRQDRGSNDCGMFVLEFALRILKDPKGFESKALDSSLANWFKTSSVCNKREELAQHFKSQALEQRKKGGFMENVQFDLQLPIPDPVTVNEEVHSKEL